MQKGIDYLDNCAIKEFYQLIGNETVPFQKICCIISTGQMDPFFSMT